MYNNPNFSNIIYIIIFDDLLLFLMSNILVFHLLLYCDVSFDIILFNTIVLFCLYNVDISNLINRIFLSIFLASFMIILKVLFIKICHNIYTTLSFSNIIITYYTIFMILSQIKFINK